MNKSFQQALDAGHLEVATLGDGTPFVRDNITYYWATDKGVNLYAGRFMAINDQLRAHDALKVSGEMMDTVTQAIDDLCASALLKMGSDPRAAVDAIAEVKLLNSRIRERRTMGLNLEVIYDLAAVWFFTEDENPAGYDESQGKQKKAHYRRYPELYDFFLQMRFSHFVPFQVLLEPNILSFMKETNLLEHMDLIRVLLQFEKDGLSPSTISTIKSRTETLLALHSLLDARSNPTTTT